MSETESGYVPEDAREKGKPVSYEGCAAVLGKGQKVPAEERLAEGVLTSDTGAFSGFLEAYADKKEFTPAELDALYEESIGNGIIDHHSIDAFLAEPERGIRPERCATRMAADYAPAILRLIQEKGIKKVETHYDSDLDAASSAYLIKSLIDNGRLPAMADSLAAVTNSVDYGHSAEAGEEANRPENYVRRLPGIFDALKAEYTRLASERIKAEGFSPAILREAEAARNAAFFEVLNALEQNGLDPSGDLSGLDALLSAPVRERLASGRELVYKDYEQFLSDFESAAKGRMRVSAQNGEEIEVNVVVASSLQPLGFTNRAYTRMTPDTIIAVFAGGERNAGDHYDIGIQPDQVKVIDLRGLTLALNKAEMQKRQVILAKPETERTDEEKKLVASWATGADREAFVGVKDMIVRGELDADEIPLKDPTVLVAGGSLIAASGSALLSRDEFRAVFEALSVKE